MIRIVIIFLALTSLINVFFTRAPFAQEHNASKSELFPEGDFKDLRETQKGRVAGIISPYVLQLEDGSLVRLTGLYFPDYSENGAGDYSLLAMAILKDMLSGQDIALYQTRNSSEGRTNRMGQMMAHVMRRSDGAWVQGALISLGLAAVQTLKTNPEMSKQMLALEEEARAQNIGIWESAMQVLSPEMATEKIGSFQIVEGRVVSAALKNNRTYLNFGSNWRDDFTVTIAPEHKRSFSNAGMDLLGLNNSMVRVRGWLGSYNGPNMEIDHPEAIQLITGGANQAETRADPSAQRQDALPPAINLRAQ